MRNVLTRQRRAFRVFLKNDSGVTAIEYGLIAALIAVAIIGVLITVGGGLKTVFGNVASGLNSASSSG